MKVLKFISTPVSVYRHPAQCVLSTFGRYHEYIGEYFEYIGGCLPHRGGGGGGGGNIMSTLRVFITSEGYYEYNEADPMSALGMFSTSKGYYDLCGEHHDSCGGTMIHVGVP